VEYYLLFGLMGAGLIFWFLNGMRLERISRQKFEKKLRELPGKAPDKSYDEEHFLFQRTKEHDRSDEFGLDRITWNDLSMDEIFKRLDYSYSAAGEEMLYRILHKPSFDREELKHRNEIVRYFEEHDEERVKLQLYYARIGRTGKYSIYEYLDYLQNLEVKGNAKDLAVLFLMIVSVGVMFVKPGYGIFMLGALVIYNFLSYFKAKGEIQPYITTFRYILRMLQQTEELVKQKVPAVSREWERLEKLCTEFSSFRRGADIAVGNSITSGDPMELVRDYMRMMFHFDLMKFRSMHKTVSEHCTELKEMFDTVGYVEAMICVALFRRSVGYYCEPVFLEKSEAGSVLNVQKVYHPLLKDPVPNSICCERGVLLTGSNASGKSTFLKTIAVNAILAQTVCTCLAESYRADFFRVYSSMSLRDDIMGGDSYFIVEIKAVKRILDACEISEKAPVLAFVDEVLRGTNTVERIAASTEILNAIESKNALCFAATHDLELTTLLEDTFDNYHFEEKLQGDDVVFAYKLLDGRAVTRNAVELLRVLGFPDEIVQKAGENAEKYLKRENTWAGIL